MLKIKIERETGKRVLFLHSYIQDETTVYAVEFSDGSQADVTIINNNLCVHEI